VVRIQELTKGVTVRGFLTQGNVTVIDAQWFGSEAIELTNKGASGRAAHELPYLKEEDRMELATEGRAWNFKAYGSLLRSESETPRTQLSYLIDPYLAILTSEIDP